MKKKDFMDRILIKNAHFHNLKNIDIDIPKNKVVAVAGVSGSGKTSIVYDILYQQSMMRYLNYRDIIPDTLFDNTCDDIEGLGPVIAVRQNMIRQANPKSVIGTKINILGDLKKLYLLEGRMICPACGNAMKNADICPVCHTAVTKVSERQLSFNSPEGMCLECQGRGHKTQIHMENIVQDKEESLFLICKRLKIPVLLRSLPRFTDYYGFDPETTKFSDLDRKVRNQFLYGFKNPQMAYGTYYGVIPAVENAYHKGTLIPNIANEVKCPECQGYRLGEAGRFLKIMGLHINEMQKLPVSELKILLNKALEEHHFSKEGMHIAKLIVAKIDKMIDFGLGYLSLFREIPSLSGGELHKLFLMQHIDRKSDSMTYVFDEPASGLHKIEREQLISMLFELKNAENSVIVVEHDIDMIQASEYVIEVGPGAGAEGGRIIYAGSCQDMLCHKDSLLAGYLTGEEHFKKKQYRPVDETALTLVLNDIVTNNLKHIDVEIPLNRMTGIAGVSGSGKSSLISGTLVPILKFHFGVCAKEEEEHTEAAGDFSAIEFEDEYAEQTWKSVTGLQHLNGFAEVNQKPISLNSRSNLLTYLNLWDTIRALYSEQAAKEGRAVSASYFSFNSKGACEKCKGLGVIEKRNAGFVYREVCNQCHGKRYRRDLLQVTYKGKNIADILDLSVKEAAEFFEQHDKLVKSFEMLQKIGLGYMKLGQPVSTLSGGERQRLKLMKQLLKKKKGHILYILDEPTAGLGIPDKERLLTLLDSIVEEGNSVIVIEHDLQVLSFCDWMIELGQGSGNDGGKVIMTGSPMELKKSARSMIGQYLTV